MLIEKCICGGEDFLPLTHFGNGKDIDLMECLACGIKHQYLDFDYECYMETYRKDYLTFKGKDGGKLKSKTRYDHDYTLAEKRIESYGNSIPKNSDVLDIGSGNGAFVDYLNEHNRKGIGVEISEGYNTNGTTFIGDFVGIEISSHQFDIVTLHDVFEHFVDPIKCLKKIHNLLKDHGTLIIDFPAFYNKEGLHHWKKYEHLWMFTRGQMYRVLEDCLFMIEKTITPIPSKIVFIATAI